MYRLADNYEQIVIISETVRRTVLLNITNTDQMVHNLIQHNAIIIIIHRIVVRYGRRK